MAGVVLSKDGGVPSQDPLRGDSLHSTIYTGPEVSWYIIEYFTYHEKNGGDTWSISLRG